MKVQTEINYETIDLSNYFDVSDLDFLGFFGRYTVTWKKPTENKEHIRSDYFSRYKRLEIYIIITEYIIKVSPYLKLQEDIS